MNWESQQLTVRVGCNIVYETSVPTPIVFTLRPKYDGQHLMLVEKLSFGPGLPSCEFWDALGNISNRAMLMPGRNQILHDALVAVPSSPDNFNMHDFPVPIERLPAELLRYTLPSRYCESDKLLDFAWQQFGQVPNGLDRVHAISEWLHRNIEYRFGSGRPDISAFEVIKRGYGVCRDFAHAGVALCRAFNLPVRYVTGHLPDIGYIDPGVPMDFHAYCEAYLGNSWYTFDPRYNTPRIGRIKLAHGLDAVDGAFATIYGEARLVYFEVWAYQVDPLTVSIGDPIDLTKRLDGTETVRFK